MKSNLELYKIIFGSFVGSILSLIGKYLLDKRSKSSDILYADKREIYLRLTSALMQWQIDDNEKKFIDAVHEILKEAYVIADDSVVLGIRKMWEVRDENGDISGKNVVELQQAMRKSINPKSKLVDDDYFIFEFPDK